jgi:uncharacterized protein (TIGR03086 family)
MDANTETPVAQLRRALDATGRILAGVRDDQWANPTPCTEWNVRDLTSHLVGGCRRFAAILSGEPAPPVPGPGDDQLGDDPVGAYQAAADALVAAFSQPGALERVVSVPIGDVPGIAALHLRITEALVHGWDLARATGQPADLPEDLAAVALEFSRRRREDVPPTRRPFAPSQPVPDTAPAIDRLAACLGRAVA